jgi:archaellum component FlaF (FlaF/FlaG flagellin family)
MFTSRVLGVGRRVSCAGDLFFGSVLGIALLSGCSAPVEAGGSQGESVATSGVEQQALTVGTCGALVEPLRSALIVHPSIVTDPVRSSNATDGVWSFRRQIENMAPSALPAATDPFLRGIFESWLTPQFVNGDLLDARPTAQEVLLDQFQNPGSAPRTFNLANAPFDLIGIANRIDLRSTSSAGEGRLIYALRVPGNGSNAMSLIVEYALPLKAPLDTPGKWAAKFHELDALDPGTQSAAFASKLQALTDVFTARNAVPGNINGSAVLRIRSNEVALVGPAGGAGHWQLREFRLNAAGAMQPAITDSSPNHDAFNRSQQMRDFIAQTPLLAAPDLSFLSVKLPDVFQNTLFGGGKSQMTSTAFDRNADRWSLSFTEDQRTSVAIDNFGMLTCNGCHNENKLLSDMPFYQVSPINAPGVDGTGRLSKFLTEGDPTQPLRRPAELTRRANDLGTLLCAPSQTDLVVTKLSWSPTNPAPGQNVLFSATIANLGTSTKAAGAINGVAFRIDGSNVSWSDTNVQALVPGQTLTLTANSGPSGSSTWSASNGAHTVEAWVDDVNRIAEGNENNNKLTAPLAVGVDLTVSNVSWSPVQTQSGVPVTFSATVTNRGTLATAAGVVIGVRFDVDGSIVSWSDTSTASLAPGASRTVTVNSGPAGSSTWLVTTGNHAISAWVDDVNRLPDVNRSNNKLETRLFVF